MCCFFHFFRHKGLMGTWITFQWFDHTGIPITLGIHSVGESGFLECLWDFFWSILRIDLDPWIGKPPLDRRFVNQQPQQIWRGSRQPGSISPRISRLPVFWKKKLVQRRFATLHFDGLGLLLRILRDLLFLWPCVPRRPLVASPKPSVCSRWACRLVFLAARCLWRVWGKVTEVKKIFFS